MKAIAYQEYGGPEVIKPVDISGPPSLKGNEVLINNHSTTVDVIDYRVRNGELAFMTGKHFPKVPGIDVSGVVEEVGANVESFSKGDRVIGATHPFKGGALAESVILTDSQIALHPESISFNQGACITAFFRNRHNIRKDASVYYCPAYQAVR